MKTPIQMLEVFVSDIIENTVLLEEIYKKSKELRNGLFYKQPNSFNAKDRR
ncbi:Uncharacterised protein [Klebsiella pneumoniae subsp. pneumoniae]|uniref:Uncharacterized protein n=1 Tax=Klebsiella pneumoniae subsp. pneumoniae TaxID=72407 RepID=A0A377YWW3_KLEPN|nr:Uncharacterised protein [Klebsiella pneumoniae subsp. pneumoniae]